MLYIAALSQWLSWQAWYKDLSPPVGQINSDNLCSVLWSRNRLVSSNIVSKLLATNNVITEQVKCYENIVCNHVRMGMHMWLYELMGNVRICQPTTITHIEGITTKAAACNLQPCIYHWLPLLVMRGHMWLQLLHACNARTHKQLCIYTEILSRVTGCPIRPCELCTMFVQHVCNLCRKFSAIVLQSITTKFIIGFWRAPSLTDNKEANTDFPMVHRAVQPSTHTHIYIHI